MSASPVPDDDMPAEIDFSGGVRGKFYRPEASINLPVYLEADVQAYLVALAGCATVRAHKRAAEKGNRDPRGRQMKLASNSHPIS
jgi:hypothetical protein